MKNWIVKNWKEFIFFILTWGIGWTLFFNVISVIISDQPDKILSAHWTIFYTSIFLLLLPFVSKIALGSILNVERDLKQTKTDFKDFRSTTQNQFQFLISNLNYLSQNLSNNISIINQIPSAERLKEENELFKNPEEGQPEHSSEAEKIKTELNDELKFVESDEEWIWIFNLLKIRVQMEQFLRDLLRKRTSVAESSDLEIKYYSLRQLFDMYLEKYPKAINEKSPFLLFNSVANAAIHGQVISDQQYNEARKLGIKVLRNIKIRMIEEKTQSTINN